MTRDQEFNKMRKAYLDTSQPLLERRWEQQAIFFQKKYKLTDTERACLWDDFLAKAGFSKRSVV